MAAAIAASLSRAGGGRTFAWDNGEASLTRTPKGGTLLVIHESGKLGVDTIASCSGFSITTTLVKIDLRSGPRSRALALTSSQTDAISKGGARLNGEKQGEALMALNGVLRPGYIQVRVTDLDAALKHYVDRVGLHEVSREADGRVYLRAWDEFDRHSVVLRPADMPGMDYVGFKVASESDLDTFARRIEEYGTKVEEVPAGEQPGLGRR